MKGEAWRIADTRYRKDQASLALWMMAPRCRPSQTWVAHPVGSSDRPSFTQKPSGRCFRMNIRVGPTALAGRRAMQQEPRLSGCRRDRDVHSSQFDRKTDCFDGVTNRAMGLRCSLKEPFRQPGYWSSLCVAGGSCGTNESLANNAEPKTSERKRTVGSTFKTVCGTQTRQDGSLNKYQPDSQIMRLVAVDGGCMREAIESDNGIKRVMP